MEFSVSPRATKNLIILHDTSGSDQPSGNALTVVVSCKSPSPTQTVNLNIHKK
jgi:hypothetical protein